MRTPRFSIPLLINLLLATLYGAGRLGADAYIDPGRVIVDSFDGWGTSLCWWANVAGGYANRTNYADLAFTKLKLNIVRYNIGGGENPAIPNTLQYRARMPGFEIQPGVWNWNADANQRWMLKAALDRGATRVEAFANSPPYWMTVSGSVAGSVDGTINNLQPGYETAFAHYLATVVSNLTIVDGVHFETVTAVNEPTAPWWRKGNNQEGCHISPDQQSRLINLLRTQLSAAHSTAGVASPEDNDEQSSINSVATYDTTTLGHLDRLATHTYGANNPTGLRNLSATLHKPLWVSEYGDGDASGMTMARRIHDDISQMGARAWVYWQVVDNAGGWGFLYNALDSSGNNAITINKKFYVMGQFSQFIPPGSQILGIADSNSLAAYDRTNQTLAVVAVNDTGSSLSTSYNLTAFSSLPTRVARIRTSATENQSSASMILSGTTFVVTLPAQSVSTYIFTNTVPRNPLPLPYAWYRLDNNPEDATPARHDGLAVGAVTYTAAKLGTGSAHFDGVSGYIQVPALVANSFTVACWVKTTATGGTGQWWNGRGLIDGEVSGPADDWGLVLLGNKAGFGVGNPDTTITSARTINNGQWHHVAASRDAISGQMWLYIDGTLDASDLGPMGPKDSPTFLHLGGIQANYAGGFLDGSIDDVQIIGRMMSQIEILNLMNHPPFVTPVTNQTILGGSVLSLTNNATDPDLPAQSLSWSATGLPDGAQVDASSGVLKWRTPVLAVSTTNSITLTVRDNGTPSMHASSVVSITILPPRLPSLDIMPRVASGSVNLSINGDRGPDYFLDTTTNLVPPVAWTPILTNLAPEQFPLLWSSSNSAVQFERYFRVRLGP